MFSEGDHLDDRYVISGLLGQGGMSHVFKAYDQHLDREVALKVLRPHLTENDSERFRREIIALARLNHPGIVSIYDLGRSNHVYFAMELVTGGLFSDLGPLESDVESVRRLLGAAISVAETLDYVHKLGMVHRDLTPRNILLTDQGHAKVMDFGLVQLTEMSQQLTRTGFTLGTPQYMAPEQAQGSHTGAHTDLYALGAVLYRAVTGIAPFEAENDQAILFQHVYGDLIPATEHNPYVPEALSQLISSLLAKNPAERPLSGYLVAQGLRAIRASLEQATLHTRLAGPAQSGVYPHGPVSPALLKRSWRMQLPEGPQWPAALTAAEGFVFIGLRSEEIRVLRPSDGSTQARFETEDEVNTAPLYHKGTLFVTSRDGALSALTWPSGRPRWHDSHAAVTGVVPYGNSLILSSKHNRVERRTLDNTPLWTYDTQSPAITSPIIHQQHVIVITLDGWLHAIDSLTGNGKFKLELGQVAATPSAKNGVLLLPERSGDLHAFDLKSRQVLWTYDMEAEIWASPVCWEQFVITVSWANVLRCLSLASGDDVWEQRLSDRVTATPIIAGGVVYVVTESGQLLAFDARSGKQLFHDVVTHGPIQASPMSLGDTLVVAAVDGTVQAYR